MDELEKFIVENKIKFDKHKPSPEIWKRLSSLSSGSKKGRKHFIFILSRAAAVVLIFTLSFMLHEYIDYKREKAVSGKINIYKYYPELQEAEVYYKHLVTGKMKEMKPFLNRNPMIESDLATEMAKLDSVYKSLKTDLLDNISNDQIIEAMILNYRLRLEILEELLTELRTDLKNYQNESKNLKI